MPFVRRDDRGRDTQSFVAAEDASRLADEASAALDAALGSDWYARPGSEVDRAVRNLCLLRRARAGEKGAAQYGDEAVRDALGRAGAPAVVWLASRAISYMDESGFPEDVEPWLRE